MLENESDEFDESDHLDKDKDKSEELSSQTRGPMLKREKARQWDDSNVKGTTARPNQSPEGEREMVRRVSFKEDIEEEENTEAPRDRSKNKSKNPVDINHRLERCLELLRLVKELLLDRRIIKETGDLNFDAVNDALDTLGEEKTALERELTVMVINVELCQAAHTAVEHR
ncbi:hypothetical protein OEA41_002908 [Lepraria neglecta]|uniref:Uncharacterized protein n=1 Tax=Lepraria neglecta TaxID=209136 RepID=A0AAD9Z3L5_9LECA|nr:hypothetical protein OEA41_002908 [Lepraria neglecta]